MTPSPPPDEPGQPVAYMNPDTGYVCSARKWDSMGSSFRQGTCIPLYRSHPPTTEYTLRAELEKLATKWEKESATMYRGSGRKNVLLCVADIKRLLADRSGGEKK